MSMPHVIDRLFEGATVIVPGDRDDVVLGVLLAHHARTLPTPVRAWCSTAASSFSPQVDLLIAGLDVRLPIVSARQGTMAVASAPGPGRGADHRASPRGRSGRPWRSSTRPTTPTSTPSSARASAPGEGAVTPLMFEHDLVERARAAGAHIVLPEGGEERILRAADQVLSRGIARLTLLGDEGEIRASAGRLGVDLDAAAVVDPATSPWREKFADDYAELRAHKGVTVDLALRPGRRPVVLRHDDGARRAGRRHGLRAA